MTTLKQEFETFLEGSFVGGGRGMPAEQRDMLEMAFYGGARTAVTSITQDPYHLVSFDRELGEFMKSYRQRHGLT